MIETSGKMNLESRPQRVAAILYWEQPDQSEAVLVKTLEQSKLLNATGRMIWSLCDGTCTGADILRELQTQFEDVDVNTLAHDMNQFLDELLSQDYLWIPGSLP